MTTKAHFTSDEIIKFLERRDLIDVYKLELKAGVPYQTLRKAIGGNRSIPAKHLPSLVKLLKPYGLSEIQNVLTSSI